MKPPGPEAAARFVARHFPHCNIASLTGSTVRGEETPFSDLDILLIADDAPSAYAEAYREDGWMIEILMHNRDTCREFFQRDRLRGRPSLPHMFATGMILVDDGTASDMQREARQLLDAGPPVWSRQDIMRARFAITNHLLDLEGGLPSADAVFAVHELANALHELVLRANGCWTGRGRRILRALERHDPAFAKRFGEAFLSFGANRDTAAVVRFADDVLARFGGRLFEGYSTRSEASGQR